MSEIQKYNCPECGSGNTQSAKIEYERGHITTTWTQRECVGYNVEKTKTTYADGHVETKETGRTPIYENVLHSRVDLTDLAREIAPPSAPILPSKADGCFIRVVKGILSVGISFYLSAYLVVAVMRGITQNISPDAGFLAMFAILGGHFSSILIFLVVAGIVYVFLGKIWFEFSGNKQKYEQEMQIYNEQMKKYKELYAQWEHLYICLRCGRKFYVE